MSWLCPECGGPVPTRPAGQRGSDKTFCSDAHKRAFQHRAAQEGRAVIALLKAWRASRNAKGKTEEAAAIRKLGAECLTEVSGIVDLFMQADRAAGRPNPVPYARNLLRQGRYIDRQRVK